MRPQTDFEVLDAFPLLTTLALKGMDRSLPRERA